MACGNYVTKEESEDITATGSDVISFRVAVRKAASKGWEGATADIKTAFLNAPMQEQGENEEQEVILVMKPPGLLLRLGYVAPWELWPVDKAVYGFRQSPKRWGTHRDLTLQEVRWDSEGRRFYMTQTQGDQNLWKIMDEQDRVGEEPKGLLLVYVDDLMVLSTKDLVEGCLRRISECWELSSPEW